MAEAILQASESDFPDYTSQKDFAYRVFTPHEK